MEDSDVDECLETEDEFPENEMMNNSSLNTSVQPDYYA